MSEVERVNQSDVELQDERVMWRGFMREYVRHGGVAVATSN